MSEQYTWGSLNPDQVAELQAVHSDGGRCFQYYKTFRRITGWPDTGDVFEAWSKMAYVAMTPPKGRG